MASHMWQKKKFPALLEFPEVVSYYLLWEFASVFLPSTVLHTASARLFESSLQWQLGEVRLTSRARRGSSSFFLVMGSLVHSLFWLYCGFWHTLFVTPLCPVSY
jgi:hypothetical protein